MYKREPNRWHGRAAALSLILLLPLSPLLGEAMQPLFKIFDSRTGERELFRVLRSFIVLSRVLLSFLPEANPTIYLGA